MAKKRLQIRVENYGPHHVMLKSKRKSEEFNPGGYFSSQYWKNDSWWLRQIGTDEIPPEAWRRRIHIFLVGTRLAHTEMK